MVSLPSRNSFISFDMTDFAPAEFIVLSWKMWSALVQDFERVSDCQFSGCLFGKSDRDDAMNVGGVDRR